MNFEALYFCSWCLLIFNILVCGDPVETSPLLPRHRAYPRRQKRCKYEYLAHIVFFRVAFRPCCVFVSKKLPEMVFWAPSGDPLFSRDGGSKVLTVLSNIDIFDFWAFLGGAWSTSNVDRFSTKQEYDFHENMRWIWWKSQLFFLYFKNDVFKNISFLEVKNTPFGPNFGHPKT